MSPTKFLVTDESLRLARWLRLCGYDTAVQPAQPLPALYRRAVSEERVIITRNRRVRPGQLVRVVPLESVALQEQLAQVVRTLGLSLDAARAFTLCDQCNLPVQPVQKETVKAHVPPYVYQTQPRLSQCPSCRRIYWTATHCARIEAQLKAWTR